MCATHTGSYTVKYRAHDLFRSHSALFAFSSVGLKVSGQPTAMNYAMRAERSFLKSLDGTKKKKNNNACVSSMNVNMFVSRTM